MKNQSEDGTGAAFSEEAREGTRWTFFSNHAHVLVCLGIDPKMRVREISLRVGITERAVTRILSELEEADVIARERVGRRNHYEIRRDAPLRHDLESHQNVGALLRFLKAEQKC